MTDGTPAAPHPFSDPRYGESAEHGACLLASRPQWSLEENQRSLTGWVGAGVLIAGSAMTACWQYAPPHPGDTWLSPSLQAQLYKILDRMWEWRHGLILLLMFCGMFLVETLYFKTQRRHLDFSAPRPVDQAAWMRIGERWAAVLFCVLLAVGLYLGLGKYNFHRFDLGGLLEKGFSAPLQPFSQRAQAPEPFELAYHPFAQYILFLIWVLPAVLIFCVPYFWMLERYARPGGPWDEFLVLARCLRRVLAGLFFPARRTDAASALRNAHVHNLFRGLLVKFFFVPWMFLWSLENWETWERASRWVFFDNWHWVGADLEQVAAGMRRFHHMTFTFLILLDLNMALLGYLASVRFLDTQITSAEPTLLGWVVALWCYPPFTGLSDLFLPHGILAPGQWQGRAWEVVLADHPCLSIGVSLLILGCMSIYAWATVAFGLRFSNLTNRGIVCRGPYAYVRHPAYIAKNLSWWLEYMPYMDASWTNAVVKSFHLLLVNGIYGLRAWTEERHLMREPHYQEYCHRVRWRFIPWVC